MTATEELTAPSQPATPLNWAQRAAMRLIAEGRSPLGRRGYLDTAGRGIDGATIRALHRTGLIERHSDGRSVWTLTAAGDAAYQAGECAAVLPERSAADHEALLPTEEDLARVIDPTVWAARREDQRTIGAELAWEERRVASREAAARVRAYLAERDRTAEK